MWCYKSPIGLMRIYLNQGGQYSLEINNIVYGEYNSAVAAADDVFIFSTGCSNWDLLVGRVNPPTDIYAWGK
ncbi:MAG: hypothetical protein KH972_07280 [Peptostreptococcaceae bacterium]|nr:hypothetical protein [Peptostreptococcaceae bacterium]